jgi:thioredoxin-like negative regulator of GroEL
MLLLAYNDAVRRADWGAARGMEERVLTERRTADTLLNAVKTAMGLGETRDALALADTLTEAYPDREEGHLARAEALVALGRREEARRLINTRLAASRAGEEKSRYYYLRSLAGGGSEASISDLRTSLFENPRNLDALIALFEVYHRNRDERHAVYYLRQALALAPADPRLLRYQQEYEGTAVPSMSD